MWWARCLKPEKIPYAAPSGQIPVKKAFPDKPLGGTGSGVFHEKFLFAGQLIMQALWMLVASLLFALMGVCAKLAAQDCSALEIAFYRSLVSLAVVTVLIRCSGVSLKTPFWRLQLSRGTIGFLALISYFFAITLQPLSTAVTLNYTSAIFLAVFLALSGWRMHRGVALSLISGFVGVALLLKPGWQGGEWLGGLIGLVSGALAGLAYFNVRELGARREPELRTVFYFSLVSSLGTGFCMLFEGGHALNWRSIDLLLGVGGLAAVAQLAMTRAYSRGSAFLAAALSYSTVIFTALLGAWFFNESLDSGSAMGMALIIGGGIAATCVSRTALRETK